MLGERTREEIKLALGSAFPRPTSRTPRSAPRTWSAACPDDPDQRAEIRHAIEEPIT